MTGESLYPRDLIERLRGALDEAEKLAREALLTDDQGDDGQWYTVDGLALSHHDGGAGLADFDAEFIAANDPAHVLRTIQAHRRIIELADEANGLDCSVDLDRRVGRRNEAEEPYCGDEILRALGSIYFPESDG